MVRAQSRMGDAQFYASTTHDHQIATASPIKDSPNISCEHNLFFAWKGVRAHITINI